MITFSTSFNPERAEYALKQIERDVRGTKVLLQLVGMMLFTEYTRSMRSGIDPRGRRLPPVAKWTRVIGASRGQNQGASAVPLVNTGSLNRNIATKEVSDSKLVMGFRGQYQDVANRMQAGRAGTMAVKERRVKGQYSGIRRAKAGHLYVQIRGERGWFTKRIVGGNKIAIRPRARKFFYLTNRQLTKIDEATNRWLRERVAKSGA